MALVFVSSLAMTGGPMAIHQAAAACIAQGADARILYSCAPSRCRVLAQAVAAV